MSGGLYCNYNYVVESHWGLTCLFSSILAEHNVKVEKLEEVEQLYLVRIPGKM